MVTGGTALAIAAWPALGIVSSFAAAEPEIFRVGSNSNPRERELASCENVEVSAGYGVFVEEGSRNGKGLYVSQDRAYELFYSDREDDGDRRRRRRRLPASRGVREDDAEGAKRSLGECTGGYWSLAPSGTLYPRLTVGDCASHPADIKVTTWSEVTCDTCEEQEYSGEQPDISCYDGATSGETSSGETSSTSAEYDDDGAEDADDSADGGTPSPAPTNNGPEPTSTSDSSDVSCQVLEVGGRYSGLYTEVGTYNGRGDFYSANLTHNLFFESEAPAGTTSFTEDDGSDYDDDDDDGRRRLLRALRRRSDENRGGNGQAREGRGLAACDNGYWIKTPTGGGYPFFAVADCANEPQDIVTGSTWLIVTCDGCAATEHEWNQPIACATGADAILETPAPVPLVETGADVSSTLPGAGPSTCEAVTVKGIRWGSYTVVGEENDRAELESDSGQWHFFSGKAVTALEQRRRLQESAGADEGVRGSRALTDCEDYWYITPMEERYPAYALVDCAYHPVDIVSTDWMYIDCEDCEVEIVTETKPEASCTGAPDNAKRGGSFATPAPTAFDAQRTPAPVSSLVSTCTNLEVTGEFPGNFSANGTYRGKMDFFSQDGQYNLYFELATSERRALLETDGRVYPGDVMASHLSNAVATASRSLALCSTGYWILAAIGGSGYPVFGVPDCAQHPADIRGNPWLVITCDTCGVEEAPSYVTPTVSCAVGGGSASGSGDAGAPTPAPGPSISSNCEVVYASGPTAGLYRQRGDYGSRGDFFSDDGEWNAYWVFYAGKPENRNRFRRGLSEPLDLYRRETRADWLGGKDVAAELAVEMLAEATSKRSSPGVSGQRGAALTGDSGDRRLEYCDDGFWLVTPRGGGFPFYGTQNCADHPADVSAQASWSVVECDGCGSQPLNGTIIFSCDSNGYTPPPSPAAQVEAGDDDGDGQIGPDTPSPAAEVGREGGNSSSNNGAMARGWSASSMLGAVVAAVAGVSVLAAAPGLS